MTAEHALLIAFGMLAGGALGYVTTWRFARRLEHHGVTLIDWDTKQIDYQATRPAKVIHDTRLGS